MVKHAQATSVDIAIRHQGRGLEVAVTDNGNCGAEPRGAPGHGLLGMRERVALYGGLLETGPGPELIIGDATVKTHVARILQKLNLRDRIQAVVLAYESGLIEPGAGPEHVIPR